MDSETILSKRFIPKDSLVSRQIVNEVLVVPVTKRAKDVDNIYSINNTGARIWELMDGTKSLEEIVGHMVEEFDVDESMARQDALEFVTKLLAIDALTEV